MGNAPAPHDRATARSAQGIFEGEGIDRQARAHLRQVRMTVQNAGSSFYWAMRLAPRRKREALFGLYAFCREIDDIADGERSRDDKVLALALWRRHIDKMFAGQASNPVTHVLLGAVHAFGLRRTDFMAVIDGMEMDARGPIVAPTQQELDRYCDCVAGAVGRLCVHVFGHTENGLRVAQSLGRALQLTNILRDVEEDAAVGRLYLPRETLVREGFRELHPSIVARDERLPKVMSAVGAMAEAAFAEAEALLSTCDRGTMRPAVVMMMIYRRRLGRMRAQGWRALPPRTAYDRLQAKLEQLWIAIRYGLL